ncbi:MAG TPA: AAA family ATPase, partial [Isosphaeraceae bacterium]
AGTPLADDFIRLTTLRAATAPRPLEVPALPAAADPALLPYIPAAIHRRVLARQSGWLAELRRVTVLFVNLPDLTHATPLEMAQEIVRTLQEALYSFEGSVNKLSIDEKGVTLVAALGLPPLAHEDDAALGVQAALAMSARLGVLGYRCGVGVTTGRVFCGTVGSPWRCEYTILGDVVNLSARLMQAAHDGILCDRATVEAARSRLRFEDLPAIAVKGKAEPVAVARPLGRSLSLADGRTAAPMVGRDDERGRLGAVLARLARERTGGIALVVGEAGIGKSRLVAELLREADALGLASAVGAADAIERSTPYYAWRPIFRQVLGLDASDESPEASRARIEQRIAAAPGLADLAELAPLLGVVLSLEWPDNPVTTAMTGETRISNANELLARVLQDAAARAPLQLILEDCHWLDSASWSLAGRVVRDGPPIVLAIVTRPLAEPLPSEYLQFLHDPATLRVDLAPLSEAETIALVARRLGVASVPEEVAALIRTKAQGNPFFSEELAYALRDSGLIRIDDGWCRVAPGSDLGALAFPDTVQGVVTSRIDRLGPQEQLTLKVASVIGRIFSYRILRDVGPVRQDRPDLDGQLTRLVRSDLILPDDPGPDPAYGFRHVITQEVAYNLMPLEQRRRLHRAVAEWYERNHAGDLSPYYPLLARHWSQTDCAEKAVGALEKAGELALRDYANQEAIGFFSQALALDARAGPLCAPARRGAWEAQLAEAYYRLGRLGSSLEHLREALSLLGHRFPRTGRGSIAATFRELARQALHRLRPARWLGRTPGRAAELLAAARVFERMAQVYYLDNRRVLSVHAAVRALNLSEAAGRSPELARSYANVAVASGLMSLHAAAEGYVRRAREVAGMVDQPECTSYVEFVAGLYWVTVGRWEPMEEALKAAMRIAGRNGERRRWDEGAFTLATGLCWRGDLARAAGLARRIAASATQRGVAHVRIWGLAWQIWCLLPRDDGGERLVTLEAELAECLEARGDVPLADRILGHGVRALALERRGEPGAALAEARVAEEVIARTEQISQYLLAAYSA